MKSVMVHQWAQAPSANIPRSSFDRSHGYKTTFDAGLLIPFFCDEALPGDVFNLKMNAFGRLATPIFPIMDNMFLETFFFAVPKRLLWDNWEKFNGAQDNPGDSTDFLVPQVVHTGGSTVTELSMGDYMGLPINVADIRYNAWWHRAYHLIYNEWFRSEDLQNSVPVNTGDGPDDPAQYVLLRRGKRHDYFTSCLPWPQKSAQPVSLPLGQTAPVVGDATTPGTTNVPTWDPSPNLTNAYITIDTGSAQNTQWSAGGGGLQQPARWNTTGLVTDLANATAATVNQLRQAFQIQKLLERDARRNALRGTAPQSLWCYLTRFPAPAPGISGWRFNAYHRE